MVDIGKNPREQVLCTAEPKTFEPWGINIPLFQRPLVGKPTINIYPCNVYPSRSSRRFNVP